MLEARIRAALGDREARGLRRTLRVPQGIDLCSNDYLGLSRHPRMMAAMAAAVMSEGCGSGGSRLLRGHRAAFARVEEAFASFKGTGRSLYFSSGYLANLAVLSTLPQRGDRILADRANHASLRDGVRLSPATPVAFAHNDVAALARLLAQPGTGHTFVVTESLFSMDGDRPPLAEYAALCHAAGATLVVDEAHAVGLYGVRGSGLLERDGVPAGDVISINTAGKALGVSGAFVAGPDWAIEYLVQRARPFVFSTAAPPAVAAALEESLGLIAAEPWRREQLAARTSRFRRSLAEAGIGGVTGDGAIIPVVIGDAAQAVTVAEQMQAAGFDVRAIRPPTVPEGTARLRLSVNVTLTDTAIDGAVSSLAACSWHAVSS